MECRRKTCTPFFLSILYELLAAVGFQPVVSQDTQIQQVHHAVAIEIAGQAAAGKTLGS